MRSIVVGLSSALVAVVLAMPAPAQASSSKASDGQDSGTVLDVASVKLQGKGSTSIVGTITTFAAFSDDDIAGPNGLGIDFEISKKILRGTSIRVVDGVLGAEICSYQASGDDPLGSKCHDVKAVRTADNAVQVTIPRKLVAKGMKVYRWRAGSLAFDGTAGCDGPVCVDSVPNKAATYIAWRF